MLARRGPFAAKLRIIASRALECRPRLATVTPSHTPRRAKAPRSRPFRVLLAVIAFVALVSAGGAYFAERTRFFWSGFPATTLHKDPPDKVATAIVAAAREQEGDRYDASYVRISYPGGDVPAGAGACTDVVIRSLRGAGYDLQQLIHEDMLRNFRLYPAAWKMGHPDANIDHRRVPNQMVYFAAYGKSLPLGTAGPDLATWLPGDIVCWKPRNGKWHTGIISDDVTLTGRPLVIHNAWICVEQDCLADWPVVGHYRFPLRVKGHPVPETHYRPQGKALGVAGASAAI